MPLTVHRRPALQPAPRVPAELLRDVGQVVVEPLDDAGLGVAGHHVQVDSRRVLEAGEQPAPLLWVGQREREDDVGKLQPGARQCARFKQREGILYFFFLFWLFIILSYSNDTITS